MVLTGAYLSLWESTSKQLETRLQARTLGIKRERLVPLPFVFGGWTMEVGGWIWSNLHPLSSILQFGRIAQLGEHLLCTQGVGCSSHLASTKLEDGGWTLEVGFGNSSFIVHTSSFCMDP
jgi:hypothetical protein